MKDEINIILFLLQTIYFRENLEKKLFENLERLKDKTILKSDLNQLYGQKVHEDLLKSTQTALQRFGVLVESEKEVRIDSSKLDRFIEFFEVAKASREYKWPVNKPKPFLYISPPSLITADLAGDIDDISNLLITLVRSATNTISIMSPFTNKEGLKSVLAPLKACKYATSVTLYLTANERDKALIYYQVKEQIPTNMMEHLKIYFCSPELVSENDLPHAKLLVIDSVRGYLGSANFTKQGLTSRFEVGVELDDQQSKTVEKLLKKLVANGTFTPYFLQKE